MNQWPSEGAAFLHEIRTTPPALHKSLSRADIEPRNFLAGINQREHCITSQSRPIEQARVIFEEIVPRQTAFARHPLLLLEQVLFDGCRVFAKNRFSLMCSPSPQDIASSHRDAALMAHY